MSLPPIWVVSLERAEARRKFVTGAFAALGLEIELVEAVDGWAIDDLRSVGYSRWRALFDSGRALTGGDVGCSLSHIRLYERAVAEGTPMVLVAEDDVEPKPELVEILEAIDDLPDDWDVVTFHSLFASSSPVPVSERSIAGHRICRYGATPFGTQCYLINLSAARRVLEVAYPVRLPADELLFRGRPAALSVYGIEPKVVVERNFGTELRRPGSRVVRGGLVGIAEKGIVLGGRLRRRAQRVLRDRPHATDPPR